MKPGKSMLTAVAALCLTQLAGCAGGLGNRPSSGAAMAAFGSPQRTVGCREMSARTGPLRAAIPPAKEPITAFTNVTLIAMTGGPVQPDMTVLVVGDRISAVGRGLRAPGGAQVVNGRGMWLMPGLVDAHMHLTNIRSIDEPLLAVALANGVTTEIEMGGSGQPHPAERLRLRDDVAAGRLIGPTLFVAAPKINDAELTRAGGAALVDRYRAEGYDLIKVYNRMSLEGYRGTLARAKQLGMPVVGHVVRAAGLEASLGAGQHGIVHLEEYHTYFGFRVSETATDPTPLLDRSAIPYLVDITRRSGVWITPTLVTFGGILEQSEDLDAVLARPGAAYIPAPLFAGDWPREVNPYAKNFGTPEHRRNLRAAIAFQAELTRAFAEAGIPLLAGTDAPIPGVAPGFGLHDELERFVAAGLSPAQALTAATCKAALYLGRSDFGAVAPGKRADLLLLHADPMAKIGNTRSIAGVMARGKWLDREALDALLRRHRRAPQR